jgi:hypothetical protein
MRIDWSASKINFFNYCRRRGFLRYILHDPQLNLSAYHRGKLIHDLVENFWDRLGKPKDIKRNKDGKVTSKKKYSNKQEFVKYAKGQWLYRVLAEERAERDIEWAFDNEKWVIYNSYITEICSPLFGKLLNQGKPIEKELSFDFILDGRRFHGFIDELRTQKREVIVRDYKTEYPYLKEESMKLKGNPQLTLYCVAVCAMAWKDKDFAENLNLQDERENFMGNPIFISERIKPELYMIDSLRRQDAERPPQLIYKTTRCDKDFQELLLFVKDVEEQIKDFQLRDKRMIPPPERGKKCDFCDMKKACVKRLEEELNDTSVFSLVEPGGQMNFSFVSPYKPKQSKKSRQKQKKFRWRKKVAKKN